MQKKRILRVCHKYLASNDGYDLDVQDLCRSTAEFYDNYVLFYTNEDIKQLAKRLKLVIKSNLYYHEDSKAFLLPVAYKRKCDNYIKDLYRLKNIKSFYSEFKKHFSSIAPEIVHIHGTLLPQFLLSAIYARKTAKVITTHHIGMINQQYHRQKICILLMKFLIHNIFPFVSHRILSVSSHGKKSFIFSKGITVINPVPAIASKSSASAIPFKQNLLKNRFSISKSDVVYFMPGRITEQKNQLRVVEAFNCVLQKEPKLKLIIAGAASDHEYLNLVRKEISCSSIPNNFCMLESLDNSEILSIISKSDYIIIPSLNEGFGRSAMEALMLAKPVIASKDSGYDDFIKDGANGLLVNPFSVMEISSAILNIRKIRVSQKYSHKEYIKKVLGAYR